MKKRTILLVLIPAFFFGCTYPYENPVDAGADGDFYQGYPVYGPEEEIPEDAVLELSGLSPADGGTTVDTTPLLDWDDVTGAVSYKVKSADTEAGLEGASEVSASVSEYPVTEVLSDGDTLWWQTAVVNEDGAVSPWSPAYRVTVEWTVTWTGLSPADGGTTMDTTPLLDWDDTDGAVSYSVKYASTEAGLTGAVAIEDLTVSEYLYPRELAYDEEVWWQVTAVNDTGDEFVSGNYSFVAPPPPPIVTMVSINGGTFTMGDTWGDGYSVETPTHSVTVSDFYLAETEVTFETWEEVYDWAVANGYSFANTGRAGDDGTSGGDTADEPATYINWRDVMVWCNAASEYDDRTPVYTYNSAVIRDSSDSNGTACDNAAWDNTADGYRLPTEAEWEYAAKGGDSDTDSGEYAGSSTIDEVAWYSGNSGSDTKTVGTKDANELGLYDMSGNVWEWCWDWYGSYTSDTETDPTGPSSGSTRVLRGGGWLDSASFCRVAGRGGNFPGAEHDGIGFRPALSAPSSD
ncbi:MAG: SUMF1/EgtB/PvdO family nonheme iron enzyme [Spirochaetales bacterium]|nr:SUMF1/EgtB/PvdO family nonheme iron enzyme [Spirochaetales bacterium]